MALIFKDSVGVIERTRRFDSNELINDPSNWSFKYITKNTANEDYTEAGGIVQKDKSKYDSDTIFLDSELNDIYLSSSVETVVIDTTPPEFIREKIYYTTVYEDHKCEITFKSDSFLDVRQLKLNIGDDIVLYDANRKTNTITTQIPPSLYISDIILNKVKDEYTFTFYVFKDVSVDALLNQHQLTITVWDIAGNTTSYTTNGKWITILPDPKEIEETVFDKQQRLFDLLPLEIEFLDWIPETKIIEPNVEGYTTVRIYNPNIAFRPIQPNVILEDNSLGIIDPNSMRYNEHDGTLVFKVTNIIETGDVIVKTWLVVDNTEICDYVRANTETTGTLGPWIAVGEGRKYKLKGYVPKMLSDDKFYNYIEFVETFLNTCLSGADENNRRISILEKIARINNFNDITKIEKKFLDIYKNTYNIEVDPNLSDLKYYLEHKLVTVTETVNTKKQNNLSNYTVNENGVTITTPDAEEQIETDVINTTKSLCNGELTLDDLTETMRYVYKTIPYYNQIKGTVQGIKMILNTLGLCVKLVSIWSEHNTVSNNENKNIERRADELHAEFDRDDYDSIDLDIGKFYLTSRFDVDLMQTDLTFREFNDIAKTIVNIIFQVKPVTRVLRKLTYIFENNIGIHFKYFNYANMVEQQYYCFNYIWDLFSKYSMSKSIHDIYSRTCNKLFIPFTADYADVTYKACADHEVGTEHQVSINNNPDAEAVSKNDVITRKANKNAFFNLTNFEAKIKKSFLKHIELYFSYFEVVNEKSYATVMEDGRPRPKLVITSKLYCNGTEVTGIPEINETTSKHELMDIVNKILDNPLYNLTYTLATDKQVKITSETNGFNMEFDRGVIALLRKTNYRSTLNEQVIEENINDDQTEQYIKVINPLGLFLKLKIAIPLGTKYITLFNENNSAINVKLPENLTKTIYTLTKPSLVTQT